MNGWRRVSRREPCPICQHADWCGVSSDGVVCHCMRVESANPCPSGGWFHFLKERPKLKTELLIDGYSGFILIDKNLQPKVALHIQNECRWALKKYNRLHPDRPLPHITPHVYRHTFCTNMVNAGMDVKVLQYIMGHSEIDVTMNVYTHMTYERAASQMFRVVDQKDPFEEQEMGKATSV